MSQRRTRLALLALPVAAASLWAGCGSSSSDSTSTSAAPPAASTPGTPGAPATSTPAPASPTPGGQLVVGFDQEPAGYNVMIGENALVAGQQVVSNILQNVNTVNGDFQYIEQLGPLPELTDVGGKQTVKLTINPAAKWSDGTDITSEDIKFTWQTIINPKNAVGSTTGFRDIEKIDTTDPKTAIITFKTKNAGYKDLYSTSGGYYVLPKHILEGKNFNTFWQNSITMGDGPFKFGALKRGQSVTLNKDPNYWDKGDGKPYLDSIQFKFLKDTNLLISQLKSGEVNFINPPPDSDLKSTLEGIDNVTTQQKAGITWEHLAFNTGKAPFDDVNVRKAIAYAVDRDGIVQTLLKGQVNALQSPIVPEQGAFYTPAFEMYKADPAKVEESLAAAGYAKDGSGQYAKNGKPLTFSFKTTAGNALREKLAQNLKRAFNSVGIGMTIQLEDPGTYFSESLPQGNFQLAEFAWSASPDPTQSGLFATDQIPSKSGGQGQNYYQYSNPEVDKLLKAADEDLDEAKRVADTQAYQKLMAEDVPLLPLYQRPETIAYSSDLEGPIDNPTQTSHFWNTAGWFLKK